MTLLNTVSNVLLPNTQYFEFLFNPARVIFGAGSINGLPELLQQANLSKPLLLSTPFQKPQLEQLSKILNGNIAGSFTEAVMHTPTDVTESAVRFSHSIKADCVVSIGGGSTIGLGKAISFRTGLPHICIPTTYTGSEMTSILGETANGRKFIKIDPRIFPGAVIYDVDLTSTLPAAMSCTSGINAIAHAIEALYAKDTNPISDLIALEGVRLLARSLSIMSKNSMDLEARNDAFQGSWLCGVCLGDPSMSLHHKLCHTLGGSFDLPHAENHTIVFPHAVAYNAKAAPDAMAKLAKVLPHSEGDMTCGLNKLLNNLAVGRALKDLGMKEEDIEKAVDIAMVSPYANVREIDRASLGTLTRRAWASEEATADL